VTHPCLRDFPVLCCSNGICLMHLADTVCAGGLVSRNTASHSAMRLHAVSQTTNLRSCSQSFCMTDRCLAERTYCLRTWSISWSLRKPSRRLTFWMWMEMGKLPSTTSETLWSPYIRSGRHALHASLITHTSMHAMFLQPCAPPDTASVCACILRTL